MAEDIIIGIKASDGGSIDAITAKAEKLHSIMQKVAAAAAGIRIPTMVAQAQEEVAASQGRASRVRTARSEPKSAAYRVASGPSGQASDTNLSRGIGGQTGASGRDFAAQAQGLGGLVHVYATFAANLFAVSAAFGALSKAMDTTNLIKGLDQLGAASGRTYSTLAKQMVSVADGAISMQQAMSSTAMATAAGMSNANVLRMTEVAKKASQALGRDMTDSMDRLTKGIIKTQPELLDELGIMARVIPAQQAYSKQIGKTVDQLSTFEKQQAFANAVLAEGEAKFSNIKLDANSYSKLSASMQNIAQVGLSLVNTVLSPIAKLLAESPIGLATVMTGIAGILIKVAIPALGKVREGLEAANKLKLEKITDFSTATAQGESGTYDLKKQDRAAAYYMKDKDLASATAEQKKKWEEEVDRIREDISNKSEARSKRLLSHERNIETQKNKLYKDAGISQARLAISNTAATYGTSAAFSELNHQVDQLRAGTTKINIGDKIGEAVPKIGALRGAFLYATGAVAIFGSALSTVMTVLAPYIEIIGLIIVALTYLDSAKRIATKEQEAFTAATENSAAAVKTAADAIDNIYSKNTGIVSVESTNAASNALTGINEALRDQITAYDKLGVKQSSYEKGWDSFWTKMGKGNLDTLVKSTSQEVPAALNVMALKGTKASEELNEALSKILPKNIDLKDSKAIQSYLDTLSNPAKEKAIKNISKAITDVEQSTRRTTNSLNDFVASLQKTQDLSDELTNKLKLTGEGAIGEGLIKSSELLGEALKSPMEGLNAIIKLGNDMKTISLLPPNLAQEILSVKVAAEGLARSLELAMKIREKASTQKEDLVNKGDYENADSTTARVLDVIGTTIGGVAVGFAGVFVGAIGGPVASAAMGTLGAATGVAMGHSFTEWVMSKFGINTGKTEKGQQVDTAIAEADKRIISQMTQIETFIKSLEPIALKVQEAGLNRFSASLSAFATEASAITRRATISTKEKAGLDTSADELALKQAEIAQQQRALDAAFVQQKAINDNTDALNKSTAVQAVTNALEDKRAALIKGDPVEIARASQALTAAQRAQTGNQVLESVLSKGTVALPVGYDENQRKSAENEKRRRELMEESYKAQTGVLNAKSGAAISEAGDKKVEEDVRTQERLLELNSLNNKYTLDRIGLFEKLSQGYSAELAQAKLVVQLKAEGDKYDSQNLALEKQLNFLDRSPKTDQSEALRKQITEKQKILLLTLVINKNLITANHALETFNQAQKKLTDEFNHQKVLQDQIDIVSNARIGLKQQELQQAQSLGYITDSEYGYKKASLELDKEQIASTAVILQAQEAVNRAKDKQAKIAEDIVANELKYGSSDLKPDLSEAKQAADYAVSEAEAKVSTARTQSQINKALIQSNSIYDQILAKERQKAKENDRQLQSLDNISKVQSAEIELEESRLDNAKSLNHVSEAGYAREKANLENRKLDIESRRTSLELQQKLDIALEKYADTQMYAAEQTAAAQELSNKGGNRYESMPVIQQGPSAAVDNAAADIADLQNKLAANSAVLSSKKKQNEENKLAALELAKQNNLLKDQESLAQSLATLFGEVGTAMGETVKAIMAGVKAQEDLTKSKKAEIDYAMKDGPIDPKKQGEIEEKYAKRKTEIDLQGIAATAKASKKMFGEKTAAYKVMDGIEKASSVMTMALEAQKLASAIANNGLLAASGIPAIYSSFMATLGPFGPPAAALAIAAFLGSAMGGSGASYETPDIEKQLSVAGTGKSYAGKDADGKDIYTNNGGGVIGDPTRVSTSIVDAISKLEEVSWEQLDFQKSDTLRALIAIKDNTKGFARYIAASGITSSGMLTPINESKSWGFGSATADTTSAGITLNGNVNAMAAGDVNAATFTNTRVKGSDWLSSWDYNQPGGGALAKTSEFSVFAAKQAKAFVQTVKTMTVDMGGSVEDANRTLNDTILNLKVNTLNTTAEEQSTQLLAQYGIELDKTLRKALPNIAALETVWAGTTESFTDFAVRIKSNVENATFAFASIGKTFEAVPEISHTELATSTRPIMTMWGTMFGTVTETFTRVVIDQVGASKEELGLMLEKSFGDTSKMNDLTKKFGSNFLTEAERLAPIKEAVNKQMASLGYSYITTKEEFKNLVTGFKVTDQATADTYAGLMKVNDSFAEVADASDKLAASALDLEIKIYELKGSNEALNLTRQKELDAMDESLRPRQRYINALTDEIALRDKLKSAYDTTNTSLTTSIKSLQDYKTALLGGTSSTMSPAEKYAQSKAIFEQTAAAAKVKITTSSSAADIKTRDDAVANLSKASDSFLANSKVMNASGTQYAADFAAVGTAVDATTGALENQQTETQKQLGFLDKIAAATGTTAQLLGDYLKAVGVTAIAQASATASGSVAAGAPYPKLASGGLASGMALVGEQGPELADFSTPARVYSNADSKNLVNNDALIAEIKALRQEVAQLREDQKEQTGHLITTTFMASTRNAETVNNGYAEALNQQNWKDRSKITID